MTFGRIGTFISIFAVSLAIAGPLVRRHRERSRASPPGPSKPAARVAASELRRASAPSAAPSAAPVEHAETRSEDPLSDALCPEGMLLVDGTTCGERPPRCLEADPKAADGCVRYAPAQCRRGLAIRACIDRDEYPNIEGMLPAALVTLEEARSACSEEGKRLCTETEWAFACGGPKALAFSYGDARDDGACNVGRPAVKVPPEALWEARDIGPTMARVDARVPSGTTHCTGPFGARDLIGNVEEWVESDSPGFEAALRGGEYSSQPTCRTTRQIHQAGFRQVHTGFRCCRDPLIRAPRRETDGPPKRP